MKDLHPARMIRNAATSAVLLSLAACGGKKQDDEKDEIPTRQEALSEFCSATLECSEQAFYEEYGSIEECVEESSNNHDEIIMEYGKDCGESVLSLLDCFGAEWVTTCDEYDAAAECVIDSIRVSGDCEGLDGI